MKSLPMRGEWIEIPITTRTYQFTASLSPCGESGLKFLHLLWVRPSTEASLPMRGEWIEIDLLQLHVKAPAQVSPHAGRVD